MSVIDSGQQPRSSTQRRQGRQVRFIESNSQAEGVDQAEMQPDDERPRSEQLGNNQQNIVEPIVLEPVIGQGAPNLNRIGRGRLRSASDGVNISKNFIIKISLIISLVHLILISSFTYAYLENWIELDMSQRATRAIMGSSVNGTRLDVSREKLAEIYAEHNDTNYIIGICVRILMLIHLMDFMMFLSLAVIAYKDPRQIYVIYKCQYLQNCIILVICIILSVVIAASFGGTIKRIQTDTAYQQMYNWQQIKVPFVQTIALILVAEFLHIIVCIGHIRGYFAKHKHQLFGRRLRRRDRSEEIYDYDPDYDMGRYQHYMARHPPAMGFIQNDHFFTEDKVIRCMNALPQFRLTASILLSNLRLKSAERPAIHEQIILERAATGWPKLGINTESKNAMLGDIESESESQDVIADHSLAYDTNSALKKWGERDAAKRSRSLGKVRLSRVVPSHVVTASVDEAAGERKQRDFFPSLVANSPLKQKEVELSEQRYSTSKFSTPTKTEHNPFSPHLKNNSPLEKDRHSSPSDLYVASERQSAEKVMPNVRPVVIMQEYLDSSEREGSASAHANRILQTEQKIVQMNHLGFNKKLLPSTSNLNTEKGDGSNLVTEEGAKPGSSHDHDGVEMTQEEYEQLLEKYEEVEDLTCAICIDRMRVGQTVIKTLCSGSNEVKNKHDVSHYFMDKQDALSDNKDDDGVVLQSHVLRGHKFHKGCFQKWLNMERERLQNNQDEIFHRCPICRQDVMTSYQVPAGSMMHSTVVGSNVLLSSLRPFGQQRINMSQNVHFIGEESQHNNVTHLALKNITPEHSARSQNQNTEMKMIYEDLQKIQKELQQQQQELQQQQQQQQQEQHQQQFQNNSNQIDNNNEHLSSETSQNNVINLQQIREQPPPPDQQD